jgi:hypothetical protein
MRVLLVVRELHAAGAGASVVVIGMSHDSGSACAAISAGAPGELDTAMVRLLGPG